MQGVPTPKNLQKPIAPRRIRKTEAKKIRIPGPGRPKEQKPERQGPKTKAGPEKNCLN